MARDQRSQLPVGGDDEDGAGPLSRDGTVTGRAYRATEVLASSDGVRPSVLLLDGTERLRVLEILTGAADAGGLR